MYAQVLPVVWYRVVLDHTGSSRSVVGRSSSSSESPSGISGGVPLKVRHQQPPSQNGRLLACLGVKGKVGCWAMLNLAGAKEASV